MSTIVNQRIKYTDKYLRDFLNKEGYQFIGIVVNSSPRRMVVKHKLCGKTYTVRVDKFMSENQRCSCMRKRAGALISNTKEYQDRLDKIHGKGEYRAMTNYIGRKKPMTIKHSCGNEYDINRAEYLMEINTGGKCPICSTGIQVENSPIPENLTKHSYLLKVDFERNGAIYGDVNSTVYLEDEEGDIEIDGVKYKEVKGRVFTQANQKHIIKLIEESELK